MASTLDARWYRAFIAPAMVLLIGITFGPFLYSIYLSLHTWTLTTPGGPMFIGMANYLRLVTDRRFWYALGVTVRMLTICLAIQVPLGTGIALLLNIGDRKVLRTLFLLPMMLTPIVAALMWQMMLNNEYGSVRHMLNLIGVQDVPIWLGEPRTAPATLVLVDSWQWTPMVVLFVLAGLNTVPQHYYEAARIEGARADQMFVRIVLPVLKPVLILVTILRGMDVIKMFDIIFVLTKGGPGASTETMTYYTYRLGFGMFDMGYAATLSLVILFIGMFLSSRAIGFLRRGLDAGGDS